MSYTLWLSADEERLLSQVMRASGTQSRQQAIIQALRDKADAIAAASVAPQRVVAGAPAGAQIVLGDADAAEVPAVI